MDKRMIGLGLGSLALSLAFAACDGDDDGDDDGGNGGSGAMGGQGCPSSPSDMSCGSMHEQDEDCGPCHQEGLHCDYTPECYGQGSILRLGCTCTNGSWRCGSSDGWCEPEPNVCPSFPSDPSCGSDHVPDQACGPCDKEDGLFCDFTPECNGQGSILELTCTCTLGEWRCDSADGWCDPGGGGGGDGGYGGTGGHGGIGGHGGMGGHGGTGGHGGKGGHGSGGKGGT